MRPERPFVAERALANHAPELLRRGPGSETLLASLSGSGERLARRLSLALAPMLGGVAPRLAADPAGASDIATLHEAIGPLAANSLMLVAGVPLLVSLGAAPLLRMVDRAFGGRGTAPQPLPAALPMAAELMIARIEKIIAAQLPPALAAMGAPEPAINPLRRDGDLAALAPFPAGMALAAMVLTVMEANAAPWQITLALPLARVATLFGHGEETPDPAPRPPRRAPASAALAVPFADVPLTLRAIIVDMCVPFTTVAGLEIGQMLPVTVAREVPLSIGGRTIAAGTIGAVDDRVAISITTAFSEKMP